MTKSRLVWSFLVLLVSVFSYPAFSSAQSSIFGPNVYIFDPASKNMQATISSIYGLQMPTANQFALNRYAILFKPGRYNLDVRVGYYTQVSGLGLSPDDVTITGAVRTQDNPSTTPISAGPGALDNFWRSTENLSVVPTLGSLTLGQPSMTPNQPGGIALNQEVWAVSQAAPLRRIHVKPSPIKLTATQCVNANAYAPDRKKTDKLISTCPTTLRLFDVGWSSGGFMADTKIDGLVESGSQQQWFSRNSSWTQWNSENWNMVFLGSVPVPAGTWPGTPTSDGAITNGGATPVVREKPFLFVDQGGKFWVMVPNLKYASNGVDWDKGSPSGRKIPIENFYIINAAKAGQAQLVSAPKVDAALALGKNVLFTPGVYGVLGTIHVTRPDTVILGLGSATLTSLTSSGPVMSVSDVNGVTIAGLTFDAGTADSQTLLQVGDHHTTTVHSADPTFLFDVFCRVGGTSNSVGHAAASNCVTINSNDVVGDNLWLWRADHGSNVGWTTNPADSGLIVNGDRVSMYGLAVEHFQKFQTVWNGKAGKTFFYQSEMPYDVPSQAAWKSNSTTNGYAAYKVGPGVSHLAMGLGAYCYFRDAVVKADHAIEVPTNLEHDFIHTVTFWLNGKAGSQITRIINNNGAAVTINNRKATLP